jgi:hypothetical protein
MAGGFPLFRKKRGMIFYGHACGVRVQRVQRGWYRPSGDEYIAAYGGRKTFTTGLRPLEMHPYPRLRRYFS